MPTTGCAEPEIRAFHSPTLPEDAAALCRRSGGLFASAEWWEVTQTHALPPSAKPLFVVARTADQCLAVLPLLQERKQLRSLTTPYTCLFTPVLADGLPPRLRAMALEACLGVCRSFGVTSLDAMPEDGLEMPNLRRAAARRGLCVLAFAHFGNWHEDTQGLDWAGYLRKRSGALRETIRRRLKKAEALPNARFDLLTDVADAEKAVAIYEDVYRRSWKQPEPFPNFNPALIRAAARQGSLRLGVWSPEGKPAAVQLWVVSDGEAIVLKLAHDEALKPHSPGTVLTAMMLRHLLDRERIGQIDFGRGDDPYKQGWATVRRQRIGLLLVNPSRPSGMAALLMHASGQVSHGLRHAIAGERTLP